jgi:hypothetical protein
MANLLTCLGKATANTEARVHVEPRVAKVKMLDVYNGSLAKHMLPSMNWMCCWEESYLRYGACPHVEGPRRREGLWTTMRGRQRRNLGDQLRRVRKPKSDPTRIR